jgi:predicted GNAT superfamily acetyltransferase
LHKGTPTDRLIAEWWLRSDRVAQRLKAAHDGADGRRVDGDDTSFAAIRVNRVREGAEWLVPDGHDLSIEAPRLAVTIPTGFTQMQQRDLPLALIWRFATREIFTAYLARGYQVVDFVLDRPRRRGTYGLALTGR